MFLDLLLRSSIQGGIAILGLYLIVQAFPSISPKVRLWLWRLLFIKLALGLIPLDSITLKVLPPTPVAKAQPILEKTTQVVPSTTVEAPRSIEQGVVRIPTSSSKKGQVDPLVILYALGVIAIGGRAINRASSFRSVLRNAKPVANPALLSQLSMLAAAARRRTPRLLESCDVATAMVVGLNRPTILLPEEEPLSDDVELILAHEIAHLRQHDLEWNAFTSVVQTLFFFHPLVWLASAIYRRTQESAADLTAIQLTKSSPRRYAEMLMRVTIVKSPSLTSAAAGISISGSTACMKQRLRDMKFINRKPTVAKIALAVVLSGVSIGMLPAYNLERTEGQNPPADSRLALVPTAPEEWAALIDPQTENQSKPATKKGSSNKSHNPPHSKSPKSSKSSAKNAAEQLDHITQIQFKQPQTPIGHDLAIDNLPARRAFRQLFETFGQSFSMTPDVSGSVTLFAHNVKFEQALRNMMGQIDANYKVTDGIYAISKRNPRNSFNGSGSRGFGNGAFGNGGFGNGLSGGQNSLNSSPGSTQPAQTTNPSIDATAMLDVSFHEADIREALRNVFKWAKASYTIAPDVQGRVTLSLHNVTLQTALENIVRQVNATVSIEAGVYNVVK